MSFAWHSASATDARTSTIILPTADVTLQNPRAISIAPTGLIYIADTGHHRVIAVDTSGQLIYEIGGLGSGSGQFRWPRDVAAEFGASVWVLDYGNRRLQRFSLSLEWLATIEFEKLREGESIRPEEIAVSPSGDLYLIDAENSEIVRIDAAGNVLLSTGGHAEYLRNGRSYACNSTHQILWVDHELKQPQIADQALNILSNFAPLKITDAISLWPSAKTTSILTTHALISVHAEQGVDTVYVLVPEVAQSLSDDDRIAEDQAANVYLLSAMSGRLTCIHRMMR